MRLFQPMVADHVGRFDDGRPDGVVREVVYPEHVDPVIPRMSLQECVDAVHEHLQYCSSLGLTQLEVNQEDGPFGARLYTEMRRHEGAALPPYAELVSRVSQCPRFGDGIRR